MSSERDERPRAVMYLRVYRNEDKTKEQKALTNQRMRCLAIMRNAHLALEAEYSDVLNDRGTLLRPGLDALIERIQEPPQVRYVIFVQGSKDPKDSKALLELFSQYCD